MHNKIIYRNNVNQTLEDSDSPSTFFPTDFSDINISAIGHANLTLSRRRPLSNRNQSTDLQSKSMDWFLYDNGLRHERVKQID